MKIIGRILVILAAALIVVGAAYAFFQTDVAAQLTPGRRGGEFVERGLPEGEHLERGLRPEFRDEDFSGHLPEGFGRGEFQHGGRHGGRSGSILGLFSFLSIGRHLLTIGVIVLVVVMIDRLISWRKRRVRVAE
jgi:hypothetical protein